MQFNLLYVAILFHLCKLGPRLHRVLVISQHVLGNTSLNRCLDFPDSSWPIKQVNSCHILKFMKSIPPIFTPGGQIPEPGCLINIVPYSRRAGFLTATFWLLKKKISDVISKWRGSHFFYFNWWQKFIMNASSLRISPWSWIWPLYFPPYPLLKGPYQTY